MFRLDSRLKVFLHREAVDGRKSINGLALLVEQGLGLDPFAQAAYVFSNRRRDRVKILLWDRNGFWLLLKRLEADRFKWPKESELVELTIEQLHHFLSLHQFVGHAAAPRTKLLARRVNDFWPVQSNRHMLNVTLTAEEFEDVGGAPGYEDFVAAMTTTPITPSIKPCVIGTVTHSTPHSSMSSQSASPCTTSKSNTQDGLRTTLTLEAQWPKLIRYVENGAWPIDNNLCENVIRPFVVGRRNWHFADTVAGANASTNLYSLIERSKANGVYRYLVALFKGLSLAKTVDDYEQLLPWHLALGD